MSPEAAGSGRPPEPAPSPGTLTAIAPCLSERAQVLELLERLLHGRCLLGVTCAAQPNEVLSSALVAVDATRGVLVVDQFAPPPATGRFVPGTPLLLTARLAGSPVRFQTRIAATGEQDGLPWYELELPERVHHTQRRRHLRARVPMGQAVEVLLLTTRGVRLAGELRDVSVTGLSLRLRGGGRADLRPGDVLPRCSIALPSGLPLICALEVCYAQPAGALQALRVGGRFLDLAPLEGRRLEAFVLALEGARREATDET